MTDAENVLTINQLTKQFGKLTAVNNLSIEIKKGQVFGILGPNGSGKTTTLGMILDVVAPTSGDYQWFGGLTPSDSRKRIGSILETPCFFPYMDAIQNLKIVSHIKKCGSDRIEEVLKTVDLLHRKNDKFKGYSLGMKQRLSIAAALLADPPVLILDEPTNGLDPEGIAEVRKLIRQIASQGKTIIIASHLLDEVQKVCTDFIILKNGVKLHEGSVEGILGEKNLIEIDSQDRTQLREVMSEFKGGKISDETSGGIMMEMSKGNASDLNQYAFEKGITLKKLITQKRSLEEEFMKILNEN